MLDVISSHRQVLYPRPEFYRVACIRYTANLCAAQGALHLIFHELKFFDAVQSSWSVIFRVCHNHRFLSRSGVAAALIISFILLFYVGLLGRDLVQLRLQTFCVFIDRFILGFHWILSGLPPVIKW